MVLTVAIAIMIVAAVAIVTYPFFSPVQDWALRERMRDSEWENLVIQRDASYATIKDLEFDRATGKLSDEDFRSLRGKCEVRAAAILQELDSLAAASDQRGYLSRPPDRDSVIERQVRQLRRNRVKNSLGPSQKVESFACPKCGAGCSLQDAFCAKCGAAIRGQVCPTCGTRAAAGDKFCARCGARIGSPAAMAG